MFKFGTIGAFKQVRNNPRCDATIDLKNGMVVIPDDATGNAPTPADAATAQGDVWVVNNIIDKPEVRSKEDFVVETGEKVRAFLMSDLKELPVEIDDEALKTAYANIAVGDVLVPCNDADDAGDEGKWKEADGVAVVATDYKVNLEVLEKTTFGTNGLYCKVKVN